jgi:cobalt-precorrin 5A hydrolase
MKTAILAFSARGHALGQHLAERLGGSTAAARCEPGALAAWTRDHFGTCDALIYIGAAGIAVRAIAPYLKSKASDPAVVVVDECGRFSISLLSGHLGGANALAEKIAALIGATPVVTTATDISGVFAVDSWAKRQGLIVANPARIKGVSARLLAGETVSFESEFLVAGAPPKGVVLTDNSGDIRVSWRAQGDSDALHLVPPAVTLGIGCRKGTAVEAIDTAFSRLIERSGCHPAAIAQVCSIDLKKHEPGILAFCARRALPYLTFSAQELADTPGEFQASAFVKSVTGVDNVCERSAVRGSGAGGQLIYKKCAENGVTMALAIRPYPLRFDEGEYQ